MRRHTALMAGALALAIATAPQLGAQDTTQKSSTGEVMTMSMPMPTFDVLLTSLNASDSALVKLRALPMVDSTTKIVFVDVEPLLKTGDKAAYDKALEAKTADIAALRTGLVEFPVIVTKLEADPNKLTTADVVTVDVTPEGEVWVFYHRPM